MKVGYQFSPKTRSRLLAVSRTIMDLPDSLDQDAIEGRFLVASSQIFADMQWIFRRLLLIGYWIFDVLPFLFGFGFSVFHSLPADKQKKYLEKWLNHRWTMFRDLAKGVRGVAAIIYFSDKDIWQYIDYDPHAHINERIAMRERIMQNDS